MEATLVQIITDDGVELDGCFFQGKGVRSASREIDAMILVHGSGSNFYAPLLLAVAGGLRVSGYPSVSFNTRGHDLVWGRPGNLMGNSFEIMDLCRFDLKASIDWLWSRGHERIGLFGHSLGANKVIHYQAVEQDPRVVAVIASSPVRLSHSYFLTTELADEHKRNCLRARNLAHMGQPDALLEVTFPMPHLFSARAYLDKHGPGDRYDPLNYVRNIKAPFLIMTGSLDEHPRKRGCAVAIYSLVEDRENTKLVIAEGADYVYTGMLDKLADTVVDWIGSR